MRLTKKVEGEAEQKEIRVLKQGDFFGEKALLGMFKKWAFWHFITIFFKIQAKKFVRRLRGQ